MIFEQFFCWLFGHQRLYVLLPDFVDWLSNCQQNHVTMSQIIYKKKKYQLLYSPNQSCSLSLIISTILTVIDLEWSYHYYQPWSDNEQLIQELMDNNITTDREDRINNESYL